MKLILIKSGTYRQAVEELREYVNELHNRGFTKLKVIKSQLMIKTDNIMIGLVTPSQNIRGVLCDEAFGFDTFEAQMLRCNHTADEYPGSWLDYVINNENEEEIKMEPKNYERPSMFYIGGKEINEIRDNNSLLQKANRDTETFISSMMAPAYDFENAMRKAAQTAAAIFGVWDERVVPQIIKVIFNEPATIVFWSDETKTVVKAQNEVFDQEKGLAMAIAKKALGNRGNYFNEIKKWTSEEK